MKLVAAMVATLLLVGCATRPVNNQAATLEQIKARKYTNADCPNIDQNIQWLETQLRLRGLYNAVPESLSEPDRVYNATVRIAVWNLRIGYAPGVYECSVTTAPTGGRTANAIFSVNDLGAGVFQIADSGEGYVTAPAISVVTPAGNSIQSITITCAGSYYDETDAIFNLVDASGQGCVFGSPLIVEGKINDLPVIRSGYGYSNNPQIQFFTPLPPAPITIPANQVLGVVSISAASANAILTTANSRDITLEIYETNGVDEQVVAQAVVNLAKRVME